MSDEQRARFSEWWQNYLKTCVMVSTETPVCTHWSIADTSESIAWQAWQAASRVETREE